MVFIKRMSYDVYIYIWRSQSKGYYIMWLNNSEWIISRCWTDSLNCDLEAIVKGN